MKRNKVLFGLYAGLLTLAGGIANAQTGNFYELGPDNVGGQVSSLIVSSQDTSRNTIYAGATTGGLFLKTTSSEILGNLYASLGVSDSIASRLAQRHGIWHHVPYYDNGREVALPISCMAEGPDGTIFIGTGSDVYNVGSTYGKMSRRGMGLFRYIPSTNEFKAVPSTVGDTNFYAIHMVDCETYNTAAGEMMYLYVGTSHGLYRWVKAVGDDNWSGAGSRVFSGNVDNFVVAHSNRTGYFSSGNQLYRIADITASASNINPVNISGSNAAFGGNNSRILLAISQSATPNVYAMVINQAGYLDALYMTSNDQTWTVVTSSTIMPFTYTSGLQSGAIAIDPSNPRRVIIGGTNVFYGEGFSEGRMFQWTASSSSEFELNGGEYMATVYGNPGFVHSGIHQIVPVYHEDNTGSYQTVYFATDGGVYSSKFYGSAGFDTIFGENNGLNNLQINGLAVTPDGSVLMGANANACPIIDARFTHNGGSIPLSWYDYGNRGIHNHTANVLWTGNGGAVAASAYQQVSPQTRRTIFTSSENAFFGRSYADYLRYTNPTTWTSGNAFKGDNMPYGPAIGSFSLYETDTNTTFNNYLKVAVDTFGYIFRPRVVNNVTVWDTVWLNDPANGDNNAGNFIIRRGDKALFGSRAQNDYPFEYIFQANQRARDSITIINPIHSRMLAIGFSAPDTRNGDTEPTTLNVFYTWQPTDFTRVYDSVTYKQAQSNTLYEDRSNELILFSPIYKIIRSAGTPTANLYPRQAVFSNNGLVAFVSAYDVVNHRSMIVRIKGFENADYTDNNITISKGFQYDATTRRSTYLTYDTLKYNGSIWFPRPISNIAVDRRRGHDRLVLTFEDFSNEMANVAIVDNATGAYTINEKGTSTPSTPAYTAIVEDSTGTIYVGTEDGVFTLANNATVWNSYANLTGVPVTAIVQQTAKLPIRHNLTHTSITPNNLVFAKTKWPRAIYFGTYGRGVFMDMTYVTDTTNEIVDSVDWAPVGIPTVQSVGANSVRLSPNPVHDEANLAITANVAGNGGIRIYDINGRLVMSRNMGYIPQGEQSYTFSCEGMNKGMYLINVIISGHTATTKMIVR